MRYIHLSGVCTGMDTQQTTVLVAVMIGGGVVHPMMPNEQSKNKQLYWYFLRIKLTEIQLILRGDLIPVEHIKIQAGEHAFPRSTCRK